MPISSNRRQRIINFATPKVADLVVVERIDASKNVNSADAADNTAYGSAHPDATKFPDFKLSLIKDGQDEQGQFQLWYYVKDRANQDDYNWEFQAAGASNPHYDTVVRTYVILRSSFDESSPEITTAMPITSSDPFESGDNYILFEKKQVRSGDETLDSLFVVEQRVYVKRVPMWRVDTDPEFPEYDALVTKETLWYVGENPKATRRFLSDETLADVVGSDASSKTPLLFANPAAEIGLYASDPAANTGFWGVDGHGVMREGKQLTDNWYAIIEKQVVGATGLLSTINTYQNYSWPAVLNGTTPAMTTDELSITGGTEANADGDNKGGVLIHSWSRRTGGHDTVATPIFKRQSWGGPTKMKIERFWSKTAFPVATLSDLGGGQKLEEGNNTHLAVIHPMLPEPINFLTPIFTMKVRACLHTRIHVHASSGTDHEVYDYGGSAFTFARTNYEDWPAELVISDTQTPFRGGYLRERTTAYHPDVSDVG